MDIDLLLPDVLRKLENLVRTGTIAEVRHELPGALVRVQIGKNLTDWRPYHDLRAGNTRTWNPPTVGEQVTLLSPDGDLDLQPVARTTAIEKNPRNREDARCAKADSQTS
ncbi:phage baseplate assembly protein V, partial [Pseudacidovorax sp. 1753]|uniref:phage baseplate assembly protein V n=1 Tax=Pseudacidovorax sp. 1753 TaxID=3156419 RepID=UPI0033953925